MTQSYAVPHVVHQPTGLERENAIYAAAPATRRPLAWCDTECYADYWLCKFLFEDGHMADYSMWPGSPPLNRLGLLHVLATHTVVTFNGENYDCPMISYALSGASCQQLKDANDAIILRGIKFRQFYELFQCGFPFKIDHIDIMEVLPGVRIGLKAYMGIAHCPTIQDLPYDPTAKVDALMRVQISKYCGNDLYGTRRLYEIAEKKGWNELRRDISATYGVDVRSKSDAQIAEAVAKVQLGWVDKRVVADGFQFTYVAPACINFNRTDLQDVLRTVQSAPYTVRDGAVTMEWDENKGEMVKVKTGLVMPKEIASTRIRIGNAVYKFGSGGLHSQESAVNYRTIDNIVEVIDADVGSFYPRIRITNGWYPEQCGPQELANYSQTFIDRLGDKAAGRKNKANSKKIILNGNFGKLNSKYSIFYAPELMVQITLTGQLMLLMLIERLEAVGIQVASANTDGIVTVCPWHLREHRNNIFKLWELDTRMGLEYTRYSMIYLRDVNNYFAVTIDGEIKRKGVFTAPEVGSGPSGSKAPNREICADAVIAYLKDGTPIERTVYYCNDVRKFATVRNVKAKSGCIGHDGEQLGKVVRWVYRKNHDGALHFEKNGKLNQVADSLGAWPMMTLPADNAVPDWLDRAYYIHHAQEMLKTLGVVA